MTEIAIREEQSSEVVTADAISPLPMTGLVLWAAEARQAGLIAKSLAMTSFVPKAFQGKPAEVTAAILAGKEIGLEPMASLRAIDVIQGKPALSALAQRALVQRAGHDIWVVESTETRAIVCGQRRDSANEQRSVWTIERAKKLGLMGKDNWRNQPQSMLIARATAEACRLTAADVLLGMPYSAEELSDEVEPSIRVDQIPVERPKRTAKRKPVGQIPPPEPELDEPLQLPAAPGPAETPAEAAVEPELDMAWPEVAQVGGGK